MSNTRSGGGVDNGEMKKAFSRREWVSIVAAAPVVAQVASTQVAPPIGAPAGKPSAAEGVRKVSGDLANIEVPMSVEPAFRFQV